MPNFFPLLRKVVFYNQEENNRRKCNKSKIRENCLKEAIFYTLIRSYVCQICH